jgi:hypothetical protein
MGNYFIKSEDGKFHVIERDTDQNIKSYNNYCKAKKQCDLLNSGVGFDGWTPAFIIKT